MDETRARDGAETPEAGQRAPATGSPRLDQAEDRVPVRGLLLTMAAVVVVTLLSIAWGGLESEPAAGAGPAIPEAVPVTGPERLGRVFQKEIPATSTPRRLAAARERLETWGWTDRDQRLVRIPIERAIELRVARGEGS